jgi:Flp pilus assembly protein TadD
VENRGDILLLKAENQDQSAQRRSSIQEKPPLSETTKRLYEAAARWYRQALEIHPQSIAALNGLGVCLVGLQRYQEAAEVFRKALTVLPTGEIYLNLGIAYDRAGEQAKAREAWEKGRKVK